jgi:hypothetical protein
MALRNELNDEFDCRTAQAVAALVRLSRLFEDDEVEPDAESLAGLALDLHADPCW